LKLNGQKQRKTCRPAISRIPLTRMILDQRIIDSDFAFDEAQLWVFIMARALDYKWNTSVVADYSGKTYTANTIFALRNAD